MKKFMVALSPLVMLYFTACSSGDKGDNGLAALQQQLQAAQGQAGSLASDKATLLATLNTITNQLNAAQAQCGSLLTQSVSSVLAGQQQGAAGAQAALAAVAGNLGNGQNPQAQNCKLNATQLIQNLIAEWNTAAPGGNSLMSVAGGWQPLLNQIGSLLTQYSGGQTLNQSSLAGLLTSPAGQQIIGLLGGGSVASSALSGLTGGTTGTNLLTGLTGATTPAVSAPAAIPYTPAPNATAGATYGFDESANSNRGLASTSGTQSSLTTTPASQNGIAAGIGGQNQITDLSTLNLTNFGTVNQ